ncbi:MAG: hypothetical protein OXU45_09305, partial [Candidatus Melainabacteria bacterium]|nr:hypothetical protein [Candidatus Melainabacteria bacterium]
FELPLKELDPPKNTTNDNPTRPNSFIDFVNKKLVKYTTTVSALTNFISAPLRLFDDNHFGKRFTNWLSMFLTKSHLLTYAAAGLDAAFKQKNPFLVFSFATEGIAAIFGLRKIYMFRGIATGVDGAVAAFKEKFKEENPGQDYKFKTFTDGFKHGLSEFKKIAGEIIKEPSLLYKLDGVHTLVSSSIMMVAGALWGMLVNDKVGGSIRDIFGGFNDIGLTRLENPTARQAGIYYVMGTAKDFIARFFGDFTAKALGIGDVDKFKRFRDLFHELALGFDRIGQLYFLRYNQEQEKAPVIAQPITIKLDKENPDIEAKQFLHQMAV